MSASFDVARNAKTPQLQALHDPDQHKRPPVLAIYIEPAPYIVGFIEHIRAIWQAPVEVAYVEFAHSQNWNYTPSGTSEMLMPTGKVTTWCALGRLIGSGRYRLVHLAGWGHPTLLAALAIAKANGIPVTMESDTPMISGPGGWKAAAKRIVYPLMFALPSAYLPGGSRQAAYLRHYAVGDERIRVAQMTVDVDRIRQHVRDSGPSGRMAARKRFGIADTDLCILYVGRLETQKGIRDLLRAYRVVIGRTPGARLLIVGDGSLRGEVEVAAAAFPSIRYAGRLAGDDVWESYRAADVFVLPSHTEPWGLVVNEAMAAGLPVIVTDRVGCADDLVQDGSTGLVVPAHDPESLAAAIGRLSDDRNLRRMMADRAAQLISTWTLRNQAERSAAVWQAVLQPGVPG